MKFACLSVLAAYFALSVSAQALTLECSVPSSNQGGGFVTELYVFQYDEDTGKALAADGWIMEQHDAPIPAKVSEDTDKKLVLTWTLRFTVGAGQQTKMQYRATYFKGNRQVIIRAVPGGGYSNNFEGRGKCKEI